MGSASFVELDIETIRGLNLQIRYAHQDPNWEYQDDWSSQYMGGIVFYPVPYFSTTVQYRSNQESQDLEQDNDEILLLGHFYF